MTLCSYYRLRTYLLILIAIMIVFVTAGLYLLRMQAVLGFVPTGPGLGEHEPQWPPTGPGDNDGYQGNDTDHVTEFYDDFEPFVPAPVNLTPATAPTVWFQNVTTSAPPQSSTDYLEELEVSDDDDFDLVRMNRTLNSIARLLNQARINIENHTHALMNRLENGQSDDFYFSDDEEDDFDLNGPFEYPEGPLFDNKLLYERRDSLETAIERTLMLLSDNELPPAYFELPRERVETPPENVELTHSEGLAYVVISILGELFVAFAVIILVIGLLLLAFFLAFVWIP